MKHRIASCALALVLFSSSAFAQEQPAPDNSPVASTEVIEVAPRLPSSTYRWYVPTARDQLMPLEQPRTIASVGRIREHTIGVDLGFMQFFAGNYGNGQLNGATTATLALRFDYALQSLATVGATAGYFAAGGLVFAGIHVGIGHRITLWRAPTWMDVQLLLPELRARAAVGFDAAEILLLQVALMPVGVRLWGCNWFAVDVRLELPSVSSVSSMPVGRNADGSLTAIPGANRISGLTFGWGSSITASLLL